MRPKKRIVKKFFLIAGVICIAILGFVVYQIKTGTIYFNSSTMEANDYHPQFKNGDLELVLGSHPFLYYQSNRIYSLGDSAGFTFIEADTLNYKGSEKTTSSVYYRVLDNKIDYVFPKKVVVFELPDINPYCLGIYKDGVRITNWYYRKYSTFDLLPAPSESWMCSMFDFEAWLPPTD